MKLTGPPKVNLRLNVGGVRFLVTGGQIKPDIKPHQVPDHLYALGFSFSAPEVNMPLEPQIVPVATPTDIDVDPAISQDLPLSATFDESSHSGEFK